MCFKKFVHKTSKKQLHQCVCGLIQLSSVFGCFDVNVPGRSVEMLPSLI